MYSNNNQVYKVYQIQILVNLNKSSILTYLALSVHAAKDDTSSPCIAFLEGDTGLARRSIFRALTTLKEAGLIKSNGERDGVTIYKLQREGSFIVLNKSELSNLKGLSKSALTSYLRRGDKKLAPPKQKNGTPLKMAPPSDKKMTPNKDNNNNYNYNLVNVKESKTVTPQNVTPPKGLTVTQHKTFNVLYDKWSSSPYSRWVSQDPVKDFLSIVETNKAVLKHKDLATELRVFDAYLMELVIKRLGSLDSDYSGTPFIFHGKGWLKGLNRWLSSKTPASMTSSRQNLIHTKGIEDFSPKKTVQYDVEENEAIKAPRIDSKGVQYPSGAKDRLESFTGCPRTLGWLEYLVDKEARFPIYEDRVNYIARHAEKFTADQISFIESNPALDTLALFVHFRPSNCPEFYPLSERGV